jgi:hypothetical protein
MDMAAKINIEGINKGADKDSIFIRTLFKALFNDKDLINKSVTGSKNRCGSSTIVVDQNKMNLIKGKCDL